MSAILQLKPTLESPGGLVKTQPAGPSLRASDSVVLRWGQRICMSNKFPGDASVGLGPHLELLPCTTEPLGSEPSFQLSSHGNFFSAQRQPLLSSIQSPCMSLGPQPHRWQLALVFAVLPSVSVHNYPH